MGAPLHAPPTDNLSASCLAMCGIAGFTHSKEQAPQELPAELIRCLRHRGPDQHGCYEGKFSTLVAVRLSVLDPMAGAQPIVSRDGDTILAFNGEIYNHVELRNCLARTGSRFETKGDTEVVLEAFRRWGPGCFSMFRGMFAIAILIESERRVILARDRMGIKPLYYCRRGSALHFGSELKAILADRRISRRIDRRALSDYLSLNYVPSPLTLVEGILKLPPAHWLEWKHGAVALHRYWEPPDNVREDLSLEDARGELDRLLSAAVREQVQADVPLGLWISGGVDSSLILHYAAQHASTPLRTFSLTFPGEKHDESRYSRALAAHYGTRHEEHELVPNSALRDAIHSIVHFADEPNADAGALPLWFLSALTRRHATVALSGEGADELFGGYKTYLADRLRPAVHLLPRALRHRLALLANRWPVSDDKVGMDYKLKRFLRGSLLPAGQAHFFWNGTFSEAEKKEFCRFNSHPSLDRLYRSLLRKPEPAGMKDFLKIDQTYYLSDDILAKCDRMSMAHSIEVRPPFLDDRIVDFACALPPRLLGRWGALKPVPKSLLASKVPRQLRRRGKEGLDIPIHRWLRGPLRELALDALSSDRVEQAGLLSADFVSSLLTDHLERRTNVGYHLWGLLVLSLWIEHWRIDTSESSISEVFQMQAAVS